MILLKLKAGTELWSKIQIKSKLEWNSRWAV